MKLSHRISLWLGFLTLMIAAAAAHGDFRKDATSQVDEAWAGANVEEATDDLLPMDRPNPSVKEQDYITYRYTHWFVIASREYSFSLIRNSYERPGPLTFYWTARVSMPDGDSIFEQLAQLHSRSPNQSLSELEQQIRIKTWTFDERTCPIIATRAAIFLDRPFKVPFNANLSSGDTPSFEFHVNSLNTSLTITTRDGAYSLVSWGAETRRLLAQCGAPETAASRQDQRFQ